LGKLLIKKGSNFTITNMLTHKRMHRYMVPATFPQFQYGTLRSKLLYMQVQVMF